MIQQHRVLGGAWAIWITDMDIMEPEKLYLLFREGVLNADKVSNDTYTSHILFHLISTLFLS